LSSWPAVVCDGACVTVGGEAAVVACGAAGLEAVGVDPPELLTGAGAEAVAVAEVLGSVTV